MFNYYFKFIRRHLIKDRQFSILNIVGLSTGLACALLIYLWVNDEMHMDTFHEKGDRLYQVLTNQKNANDIRTIAATNALLARTLKDELPEVEYAAAVLPPAWFGKVTISAQDNMINATGPFADKDYFNVFSYRLLQGNKDEVLANKNSIVLSKNLALRLFHDLDNVIGKRVEWQHEQFYTVTGIFEGTPTHSSDQFDFILPMENFLETHAFEKNWGMSADPSTYVVLKNGTNISQFNLKIAGLMKTKYPQSNETLFARLYSKGYLYGRYENGVQAGGRIEYVRLFSIIAIFILVIACINFMNLSTAKASRRAKEVGIKKVVGARRGSLILQYIGESMLLTFASMLIALCLVVLILPEFNAITGKQLTLYFDTPLVLTILSIGLVTGLISGSYPALYLSAFNPLSILKGKLRASAGELWVRKGLVVFQFSLSVIFIAGILIVYKQMKFIQTKNLGYNKDNVLSFNVDGISGEQAKTFLADIKNIPGVINASGMDHSSLYAFGTSVPYVDGKPLKDIIQISNIGIDYGLIETLGLQITAGRGFSTKVSADTAEIILNQAAVDAFGLKNPIGRKMQVFYGDPERTIVGVVNNFHFQSLHETVKPFALRLNRQDINAIMTKIKAGTEKQTIGQLEQLYKKYHPGFPFEYRFVDDDFQAQYVAEKRITVLSRYFGGLAILISCLGLFGLAAFTAERRIKEIGVRKVLGATATHITLMLSMDFLQLVAIAVLIAFPLSWWAMHQWLQGFAYRVDIGAGIFLVAGTAIILITLVTISYQSIKAALTNPVTSLRTE